MSRKRKLELIVEGTPEPSHPSIDWNQCLLCQENTGAPLINGTEAGLKTLSEDLLQFSRLNGLPYHINLSQVDEGNGLEQTLINHNTKYHKTCRTKFDKHKLKRFQYSLENNTNDLLNPSTSADFLTRSKTVKVNIKYSCLFCDGTEEEEKLVSAQTLEIGANILFFAKELQDEKILTKLSSSDLVAQEAKYHKICYLRFKTKARSQRRLINNRKDKDFFNFAYGSALSQLVDYIESFYNNEESSPVFKLATLTRKMEQSMRNFGVEEPEIHRTRFKDDLLSLIPGLEFTKSGREILLYFKDSVGDAILDAIEYNSMSDGLCLARAAKIVRRDLFGDYPKFDGSFSEKFIPSQCVNKALVLLLQMILEGP